MLFTDEDAAFLASLGLNCVRVPMNYRHFEDDMAPFVLKEEGFARLDRVVDTCARHGLYTILDLHALPGFQNQHWHSDNPTHWAFFWTHRHFQDRSSTRGRHSPRATATTRGSPAATRSTSPGT
ncbi:MAG: glycoside hydrolase family 5 protein [Actinomycetes bacterium]